MDTWLGEVDHLFHFDHTEFSRYLRTLAKWTLLGSIAGVLSGSASAVFLFGMDWATRTRVANPWIVLLLPAAGMLMGWVYQRYGKTAGLGNNLVIEEVHSNKSHIPLRMAPFVLVATVGTHLFGGSAGREGTAIQMGASLSDWAYRLFRLDADDRRLMLMAGISGGFGSVFGTPVAGFVFGLEVQSVGRIRYEGIIPCLTGAFVGDLVTRAWGAAHSHYEHAPSVGIEPALLAKVAFASLLFGLVSMAFIELIRGIKYVLKRLIAWGPLHPFVGGIAVIGLTALAGTQLYLGLSLPLIKEAVDGTDVPTFAFLWKLVFTTVTLGSGFFGGEVTVLFATGSSCGFTLGRLLEVDPNFLARIGFVAVFAGCANTPLACGIMGVELFGSGPALYLFLGCVGAYLASGHRGIYVTQRVDYPKVPGGDIGQDETLRQIAERRGGWLPPLPRLRGHASTLPVRSAMSSPAVAIREDASVTDLVELALREGVRAVPVVGRDRRVLGIVSDDDLQRLGMSENLTALRHLPPDARGAALARVGYVRVRAIMSRPVITVLHTATLKEAADLLTGADLKRLPVVDQHGHLMGLITRSDLLRQLEHADTPASDAEIGTADLEEAVQIGERAPLADVVDVMLRTGARRLVVTGARGEVVGMLTQWDVLQRLPEADRQPLLRALKGVADRSNLPLPAISAADLMTSPAICVRPDTTASEALRLLMGNGLKRLPVIDDHARAIGMVSRATVLRSVVAGWE